MHRVRTCIGVALVLAVSGCGSGAADPPAGLRVQGLTVDSRAVHRKMAVKVVLPAGDPRGRPLLVFLHGRGNDENSYLHGPLFDALKALGPRAPIVAFPDGADDKYWHDRASGRWGTYVIREVIPRVARRYGADRRRVAIGGISMGGFGAFDLARLHPGRFCAVGGHSPALWRTGAETAPGAFDDAADFARHDVVASPRSFRHMPVWLDAGDRDPFRPGDDAFAGALRAAGVPASIHTWPGGHDSDYWNAHWRAYMRFYAGALARCQPHRAAGRASPGAERGETDPSLRADEAGAAFADIWCAIPKVVFSRTLDSVQGNARLAEASVAEEVAAALEATDKDVSIAGAGLAAQAIGLGLVDELRMFRSPVVVGGGTPFLPPVTEDVPLDLIETGTFGSRVIYERYGRAEPPRSSR